MGLSPSRLKACHFYLFVFSLIPSYASRGHFRAQVQGANWRFSMSFLHSFLPLPPQPGAWGDLSRCFILALLVALSQASNVL